MTRVSQLYDLQQIDSGLDRRIARLRQIDEQMVDSPALLAAREAHYEAQALLTQRQNLLKQLSQEAEDLAARIKTQDKRLYDGSIKNPKELGQIHAEVAHMKQRRKEVEEKELDAMMLVEESENLVAERESDLQAVQTEWEQFTNGLMEEKDMLAEQVRVLQVKRQRAIGEMPWADLQAYERMRRTKGGVAVAAVHDGSCDACRVGVPVHLVRAARPGTEIVPCPSCGRILYPTTEVKFKEFDHNLDNINR